MRPFVAVPGGYRARLDAVERDVIAFLVAEVARLLGGEVEAPAAPDPASELGGPGPLAPEVPPTFTAPPEDPALRRLLPDASRDDATVASEFRRLTEDDLRRTKVDRLAELWRLLQEPGVDLYVPRDQGAALAATLTDVRLVLADRLDLTDDTQVDALYGELERADEAADGDPWLVQRRHLGTVYAVLTFLQESLLTVMLADLPGDPGDTLADLPGPDD
jgi:hypothetical protein